jgi:hypothetical protein
MELTSTNIFRELTTTDDFLAKEELAILDEIIQILAKEFPFQSQIDKSLFQKQRDTIANQADILTKQKKLHCVIAISSLIIFILVYRRLLSNK